MPVVPKYEQTVAPNVRQGFETAAPTAEQLGAGARFEGSPIGPALERVAEAATYLRDQQAAQQALNAEAVATAKINEYVQTARRKTGANAWGVGDTAGADLDGIVTQSAEGIRDPAARQTYVARMRQRSATSAASVRDHEFDETKKTTVEAARASTVAAIDFGVTNYQDQRAIDDAATKVAQGVALEGHQQGWTPERMAVEQMDRGGKLHAGVIGAMIAGGRTSAAAEYLDRNSDKLDADTRTRLQANLRTTTDNQAAQSFADGALTKGLTMQQAMTEARASLSGDAEERAVAHLKLRYGEMSQAREAAQRDAYDAAIQVYAQTKNWASIPAEHWNALGGEHQLRIKQMQQQEAEHRERLAAAREGRFAAAANRKNAEEEREARKAAQTAAHETVRTLYAMSQDDPELYTQVDLSPMSKAAQVLPDAQYKALKARQDELKDPTSRQAVADRDAAVKWGLGQLGISGQKKDEKKRAEFVTYMDGALRGEQDRVGRALTRREVMDFVKDAMVDGTVVDSILWFDTSGRKYQAGVPGSGSEKAFVPKAAAAAAAPSGPAPMPRNQAEFDALPRGTRYQRPDGSTWTKQ